jgi:hypothetical protein
MKREIHGSVQERRVTEGRLFRASLAISLVVHVVAFLFWKTVPLPTSPFSAAGPRAGDSRAAGAGMQALNLQVPPSRPLIPPRVPLISLDLTEPVEINFEEVLDPSSLFGERPGTTEGAGIEGGEGRGDGGTAAEGLFSLVPPSPRGMIIPPTNRRLRGSQVEVWVFVDEAGRVVPDSTRLNPPTSDRGFNRRLIEEAAEWVFNPAMRAGTPVAAWFPYTISM